MGTCRIGIVMLLAFTLATTWAAAPAARKFATPAEVIAATEAAHDRGDAASSIDCLSSQGQADGLNMVMMLVSMMETEPAPSDAESKQARAAMEALLAEHGLKDRARNKNEADEAYSQRLAGKVTGRREFLIEAMKLMNPPEQPPRPCIKGELKELKIDGDTATGTYAVTQADKSVMSQPVTFKKEDGSWRIAGLLGLTLTERAEGTAKARPATRP